MGAKPFLLAVLLSNAVNAQDSDRTRATRVQTDSIRMESCRGGKLSEDKLTCTGARYAPRMPVIRRLTNRIDSISRASSSLVASACDPPACNPSSPGNIGYAVTLFYNSMIFGSPVLGRDTVTVCAVVESQSGVRKLAWPPLLMTLLGDSSRFARVLGRLASRCARAMKNAHLASSDSVLVTWSGDWVTLGGRRVWRPFPVVP